ncbi:MAG: hypothetical protein ACE3JK_11370 [Sporolactobacillus sp.]
MFQQNIRNDQNFNSETANPSFNSREFPQGSMSIPGLPQQPGAQGYVSSDTPFPYAFTNGTESYVDQSFAWPPSEEQGDTRVPPGQPFPGPGGNPFEQRLRQIERRQERMEREIRQINQRLRQIEWRLGIPVPPGPGPGGPR